MAAITPQQISEAGVADVTFTAAAGGGDTIAWHSSLLVIVKNDSGGSITVTAGEQAPASITDGRYGTVTKSDATLAVGAGDIGIFGPFPRAGFRDSSGNLNLTYSGVTSLTIAGIYTNG